jgi:hypothetical protein
MAQSGRFRVIANGFTVHQQTFDHALQVDGKGDEVYIDADVRVVDATGKTLLASHATSRQMGDTNGFRQRVQAGSASDKGGLLSGDSFPTNPARPASGVLTADQPPMLLIEVDLVQGQNAVAVTPSMWEWDGPQSLFNTWVDAIAANGSAIAQGVATVITGAAPPGPVVQGIDKGIPALKALLDSIIGVAADRPIGMVKQGNSFVFNPQTILLNFDTAVLATKTDFGRGPGILTLNFRDDTQLAGNYSLFIQVQQIQPGGSGPSR